MSEKSTSFQDCVGRLIPELLKEHPEDQAKAIAYSKCRKKFGISQDAIKMFNQPIAEEGILNYEDPKTGGTIRKLKKWDDLKRNIGRIVPIVDEHPSDHNGRGGLVNNERVYGFAKIKKCPKANKLLCGDPILDDDSPVKKGYSIGFLFAPDKRGGTFEGKEYDEIQGNLLIDHIALTNSPRSQHAVMVTGDSFTNVTTVTPKDNTTVNKFIFAYDRFNSFLNLDNQNQVNNMPKGRDQEIRDKLKKDNPDMDEAELEKRVKQIMENEKDQEEEEEEDEEEEKNKDSKILKMKKDELIAELSRLKAEKDSNKNFAKQIKELEAERDSYKTDAEKYKDQVKEILQTQVKINIDSLVKEYHCEEKDFDGKNASFIEGAKWMADKINQKNIKGSSDRIEIDSEATLNINDYRYDFDARKMVYIGGNK